MDGSSNCLEGGWTCGACGAFVPNGVPHHCYPGGFHFITVRMSHRCVECGVDHPTTFNYCPYCGRSLEEG